ncbi:MAG: hypothetical protein HDQ87_08255 [Clostridia bacterium]|nr:hypothetical protein [Clostridia bacterium]
MEVESGPDRSIASRLWEYDSQVAQVEQQGYDLHTRLPRPGLIALRPIPGLPRELTISLTEGIQDDWPHKVGALYMAQLDADALIQRDLICLMPFFLFHYARDLEKLEQDPAGLQAALQSLQE